MATTRYYCTASRRKSANADGYQMIDGVVYKVETIRYAGKVKAYIEDNGIACKQYHYGWNGYGYTSHDYYYICTAAQARAIADLVAGKKPQAAKTDDQKMDEWCKRLAKLTDIDIDIARAIAAEKLEYKEQQIAAMEDRQCERGCSVRRDQLIRKMRRENPLRRIEDADHAYAILAASRRHNLTNYDGCLDRARELAADGEIDRDEVKAYARQTMTRLI